MKNKIKNKIMNLIISVIITSLLTKGGSYINAMVPTAYQYQFGILCGVIIVVVIVYITYRLDAYRESKEL